MKILIKRAYEGKGGGDGFRVLVDRLWPRGLSREKAAIDLWAKDVAPTNELRTWFGHEAEKWPEFRKRYIAELKANAGAVDELRNAMKGNGIVTLVFGAKDTEHNQAVVLREYLAGTP